MFFDFLHNLYNFLLDFLNNINEESVRLLNRYGGVDEKV